jgi:hypothetical protein
MLSRLREWLRPKLDFHLDCIEVPRGSTVVLRWREEISAELLADFQARLGSWASERGISLILAGTNVRLMISGGGLERDDHCEDREDER